MKRLLVALLIAGPLLGQSIDSTGVSAATNGGIGADASNALAVKIHRATSPPTATVAGWLWLDTSTNPPILKVWNGSAWEVPASSVMPVQTDATSFPGSPVDGQLFWSKTSPPALFVYSTTLGKWFSTPTQRVAAGTSTGNYSLSCSTAVLTPPSAALTATRVGSGGSVNIGTHQYVYTYANASGGETTPSPAATVTTTGGTDSVSLTGVTTGGAGTAARRIYRETTNGAGVAAARYRWVGTISDNTTTTFTDTVADSSLYLKAPTVNHSASLPTGWTALNTSTSTTTGGAGCTASGELMVSPSVSGVRDYNGNAGATSDPSVRLLFDLRPYIAQTGNLRIRWRITDVSAGAPVDLSSTNSPVIGCLGQTGGVYTALSVDPALRTCWALGGNGNGANTGVTLPLTEVNPVRMAATERTARNGGVSHYSGTQALPLIYRFPFWAGALRRTAGLRGYANGGMLFQQSSDNVTWWPLNSCSGYTITALESCVNTSSALWDTFWMPIAGQGTGTWNTSGQHAVRFDSFTVTIDP